MKTLNGVIRAVVGVVAIGACMGFTWTLLGEEISSIPEASPMLFWLFWGSGFVTGIGVVFLLSGINLARKKEE